MQIVAFGDTGVSGGQTAGAGDPPQAKDGERPKWRPPDICSGQRRRDSGGGDRSVARLITALDLVASNPAGLEPLGERIVEMPENLDLTELRDDANFVAYVPVGSIKKGELLVTTGDRGDPAMRHLPRGESQGPWRCARDCRSIAELRGASAV